MKKKKAPIEEVSFVPVPEAQETDKKDAPQLKEVKLDAYDEQQVRRGKRKKKDIRMKLKYRTKENDIAYKAPLSYRHIRIFAWICLAISQIGTAFSVAAKLDHVSTFDYGSASNIISYFSAMPFAFFLLANFGIILRNRNNFRYLFIFYGGIMLGLYVLANLVTLHYVYGTFRALNPAVPFEMIAELTGITLFNWGNNGYMFNLFVDLFLCVLTVFFIFYTPKVKWLQGKKVFAFRALVIIPILYEAASIMIKQFVIHEYFAIPSYFFFLLTSKPPLTFAAFFIITLILKIREYKFLKLYNFDYKLLEEYQTTNAHSFRTSITIAIVFVIISNIDLVCFLSYIIMELFKFEAQGIYTDESIFEAMDMANKLGFGGSLPLMFIAPLVLLYSYTKTHKNKKFDNFLPIVGIGLVIFTLFESLYLTLRINVFAQFGKMLDPEAGGDIEGGGEGAEGEGSGFSIEFLAMKNALYSVFHPVR